MLSCWFKHVLTVWQVLKGFQHRFKCSTEHLWLLMLTLLTITICYTKINWSKDVPPCVFLLLLLLLLLLLSFSVFLFWSECMLINVSPLPSELLDWPLQLMPPLLTNNYVGNPVLGLLNIFMQMWSWLWCLSSTMLATGENDSKGVHPFACLMYLHRQLTWSTKNKFIPSSAVEGRQRERGGLAKFVLVCWDLTMWSKQQRDLHVNQSLKCSLQSLTKHIRKGKCAKPREPESNQGFFCDWIWVKPSC